MHNYFQQINSFYKEKVPKERIRQRLWHLEEAYKDFINIAEKNNRADLVRSININISTLTQVVSCYFYDVERLKHFHSIERIDEYKQGGFIIKWITKLKPLYYDESQMNPETEVSSFHLFCNEMFALKVGLGMAKITTPKLTHEAYEKLIYHLVHRSVDESMLMMWLEAIDQ